MALFNPEAIFGSLVKSLGVSPDQIIGVVNLITTELQTLQAERAAFKAGAGQMVAHFTARLDAQDARLARMEAMLCLLTGEAPGAASPGTERPAITHEGHA
jgi:hypothetical protein